MHAVSETRPTLLRRLALLLLLEGLGLLALGGVYAVVTVRQDAGDRRAALLAAAAAALAGAVLALLARAADRGRGWARSPAVVLNLVALPVGLSVLDAGQWAAGFPVLLLAGSVLYLFATPQLRRVFREHG